MSRPTSPQRPPPSGEDPTSADGTLGIEAIIRDIEADRRRLADALNNEPVQTLAHISRVLQSVEDIPGTPTRAGRAAREAGLLAANVSEQLRGLARQLRPPLLDDVGVGPALRQLVHDFSIAVGIPAYVDSGDVVRIGVPEADLVLFRVAQLALRTADEQSGASRIDVRLRRRGAHVTLTIRYDGIGLPASLRPYGNAKLFMEMAARLKSVGGRLAVRSNARIGTVVSATVPSLPFALGTAPTSVPA